MKRELEEALAEFASVKLPYLLEWKMIFFLPIRLKYVRLP
jgi:hypothetical protein